MKKFSFKSLAFLMSLIMVFSIFAPVVASAVEYSHGDHNHKKDGPINYVSIGDSMTNGFGLDGYYLTEKENKDWQEEGRNVLPYPSNDWQQVYGFLQEVPDAYPARFQKELALKLGWTENSGKDINEYVDLTQLGMSSLRAEDIWYILTYATEDGPAWKGDGYTMLRGVNIPNKDNINYSGYNAKQLSTIFRKSIEDADVISLAVGPNNFSTFFNVALMDDIFYKGIQSKPEFADGKAYDLIGYEYDLFTEPHWDWIAEHLDAATEKDLTELYEKLETLCVNLFDDLEGVIPEGGDFYGMTLQEAANLIEEMKKCTQGTMCPHGRPTMITITKTELEKRFKRR